MSSIGVGDEVLAIRPGLVGPLGPKDVPVFGQRYRVTAVYKMKYGLGCRLAGMDHSPYNGFALFVSKPFARDVGRGWYFVKVEPAPAAKQKKKKKEKVDG